MRGLRSTRWTTKPPAGWPLDKSHPSVQGLALNLDFREGAGPPGDTQYPWLPITVTGSPTWTPTRHGWGLGVSAANYLAVPQRTGAWSFANTWSLRIVHKPQWPADYTTLYDTQHRAPSSFFSATGNGDYAIGTGQPFGMTSGSWWDFVLSGIVPGYSSGDAYVNGKLIASSVTLGPQSDNTDPLYLGYNISGGGSSYVGTYVLVQYWTRAMGAQEVRSLYLNSWQIYEPRPTWWALGASGGPPPSIYANPALLMQGF